MICRNRGIPSDDITVTTLSDVTEPILTKIRPISGYYSSNINLSVQLKMNIMLKNNCSNIY